MSMAPTYFSIEFGKCNFFRSRFYIFTIELLIKSVSMDLRAVAGNHRVDTQRMEPVLLSVISLGPTLPKQYKRAKAPQRPQLFEIYWANSAPKNGAINVEKWMTIKSLTMWSQGKNPLLLELLVLILFYNISLKQVKV